MFEDLGVSRAGEGEGCGVVMGEGRVGSVRGEDRIVSGRVVKVV